MLPGPYFNSAAQIQKPQKGELSHAVFFKDLQKARELLQQGADPNERSTIGIGAPPLMISITHFSGLEMVKLLLDFGADVNIVRDGGYTPLMQSVISCQTDVTPLLIQRGAVLDKKSKDGLTALNYAERDKRIEQVNILKRAAADIVAKAHRARAARDLDILRARPKLQIRPRRPDGK